MARPQGGRICAHEQDTDDTNPILGEEIAVQADHLANIRLTEEQNIELDGIGKYKRHIIDKIFR
jgi:hypothetical protein